MKLSKYVYFFFLMAFNHASAVYASTADENTATRILVLGDSLSGAYGIDTEAGWVALLQNRIRAQGYQYRVINASVSGDTTRTGLNRLDSVLAEHSPSIVILALGGNDGLRGLAFPEIESSLSAIIERCLGNGTRVLLAGVRLPPNYGPAYNRRFTQIYAQLADRYRIPYLPRMLDQVADNGELMQADGVHPTVEAQPLIMRNIWKELEPMLHKP